ncbi:hypothetical protein E3C22_04160 [Jiella endophytica]|uniref:Uncharacterized protein n=1 Tax=Jiella endophytica TaxID=2558362 RepID=A0A4Y8RTZ2_9HYPH|nr:hypothetical protein [Jiella endophytica]TFF27656.1 hypothetical protein E3C22_04160 [Jiella endophytica]
MFPIQLFVRMAYWLRRPPSRRWLIAAGAVVVLSATIVIIENTVGWPDWAKTQRVPRHAIHLMR